MNETLKPRLVGLAVVLAVLFLLSLLLPRHGAIDGGEEVPVTSVSLSGKPLLPTLPVATPTESPAPLADPENPAVDQPAPAPVPKLAQHLEPEPATPAPARPAKPLPPPPKTLPKPTQLSKTLMPTTDALAASSGPAERTEPKTVDTRPVPPRPVETVKSAPPAVPATRPNPSTAAPAAVVAPARPDVAKTDAPRTDAVAKPSETAATPSGKGTRWYVQVGSFADEDRALTVCSLLSNIGFHGDASPISVQGRSLFRVRVGPFGTEAEARTAQARIGGQGYPQAKVASER